MQKSLKRKKGVAQKSWFAWSESVTENFGVYWDQYRPHAPKIGLFQSISRYNHKMTGLTPHAYHSSISHQFIIALKSLFQDTTNISNYKKTRKFVKL